MNGKILDEAINIIKTNKGVQMALTGAAVGGTVGFISAEPGSRLAHGLGGALAGAGLGYGAYRGINWLGRGGA